MRIFIQKAGTGAVAFYRIVQPYNFIKDKAELFFYDKEIHDYGRMAQEMDAADVIVMQMPYGEQYYREIERNKKRIKPKIMIAEFDDNIFNIHPLNTSYRSFGQDIVIKYGESIADLEREKLRYKEFANIERRIKIYSKEEQFTLHNKKIYGEIDLWKDGEDEFNLAANQLRMAYTKMTIAGADIVTVTTPYLGKIMRKYRPKGTIAVLPNLIDMSRWKPMKKNRSKYIRIGWSGGAAHYQDIYLIREAIWHILDKYPQVKFVFKGAEFPSIFPGKYRKRVEWVHWHYDVNTYPLDIRDMRVDIAICPVIDDPFNRSKSELKWLEFSAMKVPCVCSDTTYGRAVAHGKTGMVANNTKQWIEYLSLLIENEQLRKEIADKAYTRVKNYHGVDRSTMWGDLIRDTYFNIKKPILG